MEPCHSPPEHSTGPFLVAVWLILAAGICAASVKAAAGAGAVPEQTVPGPPAAPGVNRLDFDLHRGDIGNMIPIPADYQPIPGLTIRYANVGLFNGGPDHTAGVSGGGNYNTYQFQDRIPQVLTFNRPVSIPSLWLATYIGNGDQIAIRAFGDVEGANLLGTVLADTATFAGPGSYAWRECTNLNVPAYAGLIRRIEISAVSGVNANVDDLAIVASTNLGPLQRVRVSLPRQMVYPGISEPAAVAADYQFGSDSEVTLDPQVVYRSSDTNVFTVTAGGRVRAAHAGSATLTAVYHGLVGRATVGVGQGNLVNFDVPNGTAENRTPVPSSYQPIPGLRIGYVNAALFNGGPDHTTGELGGNHFNTYQYENQLPQGFTFNRPVSLPSLTLATFTGSADDKIIISAYADVEGARLLGSIFFDSGPSEGAGAYAWTECTNLNSPLFNGHVRRVEFSSPGNANLDDMVVNAGANLGELQQLCLALPATDFFPGMSRQAVVSGSYPGFAGSDITAGYGVRYTSSAPDVAAVTSEGLVSALGPGTATITAVDADKRSDLPVTVSPLPGHLVDFNGCLSDYGNRILLPATYQPVPGLTMGYTNVGIFNGGPDHTTGALGGNHFNTYQFVDGAPQVFTFSHPVSLPSLWLSTYWGSGDQIMISAYGDTGGSNLLGTVFFTTAAFAGPKNYVWLQCTNLDAPAYNGLIRRIELLDGSGNVQLDDMVVR